MKLSVHLLCLVFMFLPITVSSFLETLLLTFIMCDFHTCMALRNIEIQVLSIKVKKESIFEFYKENIPIILYIEHVYMDQQKLVSLTTVIIVLSISVIIHCTLLGLRRRSFACM